MEGLEGRGWIFREGVLRDLRDNGGSGRRRLDRCFRQALQERVGRAEGRG